MSEWREIRIGDIAKFNISSVKGDFEYDLIEYIDTSSVEKGSLIQTQIIPLQEAPSRAKRRLKKNDILISTVRPNLEHYYFVHDCQENTIVSTGFVVITPKEEVEPYFLYCLLTTPSYTYYLTQIANSHTSTYPSFNPDIIKNSILLMPKYSEQVELSKIIKTLDGRIDLLRRQNKTLEAIAQTLFKRWFVEFEFPDENGLPYKSSGGKMVTSELGEIPAGWRVIELSELVETITKGTTPTTLGKKFVDKGINFIKAESITSNHTFDKNKFAHIDEQTDQLLNRSKIQQGDFLYTIAGTIGRFAVVTERVLPANTNQAIAIIRLKKNLNISPYQLLCYLKSHFYQTYLRSRIVQAVQANLSLGELKNTPIIFAENSVQSKFSIIAKSLFKKIEKNEELIESLVQTRDILLPKLMSGQIRVK
ncbi:restriction endonuclease subunit S [bacterium]|nr:restriction endonuclease subunit S [bacterium]